MAPVRWLGRRWCSEVVTRSAKIGAGTFTYTGPRNLFREMSEEEFYRNDEFHQFCSDLGLEVFLPEQDVPMKQEAQDATVEEVGEKQVDADADPYPDLPPRLPILDNERVEITGSTDVADLKQLVAEKRNIPISSFDFYLGRTKLLPGKAIYKYMEQSTDESMELHMREALPGSE